MKVPTFLKVHKIPIIITAAALVAVAIFMAVVIFVLARPTQTRPASNHVITVYDRGVKSVFLSDAKTVGEALAEKEIEIDSHDAVEPGLDEELVADDYWVNIYRARPVTVVDGMVRAKTMTAYQTPERIAKDVDVSLHDEDGVTLRRSTDFTGEGAGLELIIQRSVPLKFNMYGRTTSIRTLGKTVGEMLEEKGVVLGEHDRVSVPTSTRITAHMLVRVWREGKQTIALDRPLAFKTQYIHDADRYVGYRSVKTEGKNGIQTISYEIEVKKGVEISRTEIARIVTKQPVKQVEVIGVKSYPNALTKSKGAQYYTDKKGVSHRETYYDLDMGVVMQACGQGGKYSVRIDGVKVDADGYVIIAANLNRYPRCSVVETSVGPGKVYDTGGFAVHHPDGFDIATDWTNNNGR